MEKYDRRERCLTCIYRGEKVDGIGCEYILIEGRSRGCSPDECDKYKKGKRKQKPVQRPPVISKRTRREPKKMSEKQKTVHQLIEETGLDKSTIYAVLRNGKTPDEIREIKRRPKRKKAEIPKEQPAEEPAAEPVEEPVKDPVPEEPRPAPEKTAIDRVDVLETFFRTVDEIMSRGNFEPELMIEYFQGVLDTTRMMLRMLGEE